MEKWVKVQLPRSYKRQELKKGGKNKKKKQERGLSDCAGESPTHHRTELILPESKHSLKV